MTVAVVIAGGCGGNSIGTAKLIDTRKDPPVNGLALEPGSRSLLLSTNRGLFRIGPGSHEAVRVPSEVDTKKGRYSVGRFLTLAPDGGSALVGSGHPNRPGALPPFLGLMVSRDRGRHWRLRSRVGLADLHVMHALHGKLYAYDAVLGAVIVGDRSGRRWSERRAPNEKLIDLVVDPADPRHLLASDRDAIYSSRDEGTTWRQTATDSWSRLAWPRNGPAYRVGRNGQFFVSKDRGVSWDRIAVIDGEPWKLIAPGPRHLIVALRDARILESTDGGNTWDERFKP